MSANDVSSLYEPINEYEPFAARIGIVDGPFEYVSTIGMKLPRPFTTRMTVVQLATGDLFLHSPIAFDATLATKLGSLGRIRRLVSPNRGHITHGGALYLFQLLIYINALDNLWDYVKIFL
jgi:hypothetical protein